MLMASKKLMIIIAVTLSIVAACACALAYPMLDHPSERTYSFALTGIQPAGYLVNDTGEVKVNFATWGGKDSDLYTTWGTSGQYAPVPMPEDAQWYQCTISIHADPGITVKLSDISLTTGSTIIIPSGGIDPAKYHTSAYMMYRGDVVHSALSSESVTTDAGGNAQMIVIVLTDQYHRWVHIDGDWTRSNAA